MQESLANQPSDQARRRRVGGRGGAGGRAAARLARQPGGPGLRPKAKPLNPTPSLQTLTDIATIVNEARTIPAKPGAMAAGGAPGGGGDYAGTYGYAGPTDESLDDIIR